MAKRRDNPKVLYISEMGELLPRDFLREDGGRKLRSTPLPWLKFRTPADTSPEGQRYAMRVNAVKAAPRGMASLAVYYEILSVYGADRIAALRGFLVNYHLLPASPQEIAIEIRCLDAELVEHALNVLLSVGLLVWRDIPDFKTAIRQDKTLAPTNDPPDDPNEAAAGRLFGRAEGEGVEGSKRRTRAKSRVSRTVKRHGKQSPEDKEAAALEAEKAIERRPGAARAAPGQPGAYKRRETSDGKRETGDTPPPAPPASSAAPPPPSASGCGRQEDEKQPASAAPPPADAGCAQTPDAETPPSAETPDAPARPAGSQDAAAERETRDSPHRQTIEPEASDGPALSPTDDDATDRSEVVVELVGDYETAEPAAEPVEPTEADSRQARPEGKPSVGRDLAHHSEVMARQVFDVLYPTREDLVAQSRKHREQRTPDEFERTELACFANAFADALAGMGQVDALRLQEWAIKTAHEMHRLKLRKPRGAWWRCRFGQHVSALRQVPAGAGPPPGVG